MAKLTTEEQEQLEALTAKSEAPDEERPGRAETLNITIDLSDEKAVERAIGLGYLTQAEADDLEDDDQADGEGAEDDDQADDDADGKKPKTATRSRKPPKEKPPVRAGYFGGGDDS